MFSILNDPHGRHRALTLLVAVGLAAYLTGKVTELYGFDLALILALVGGFSIYYEAIAALARRRISADLAVGLAAMAALYIGQYAVAAEVILIMLVGEALEHFAIDRTRTGIAALLALRPDQARVRDGDHEHVIPVEEIRADHVVILRPGDRIPVDGRVIVGNSSVDESPITGESLPADKTIGDKVFAGTINLYGALELSVERLGEETTLERIIHLVEEAEAAKAPTQRLADRYAAWFVPIVLVAAGLTWFFSGDVIRSVAVLVVACPCALVLATPTAIAAGMGSLVRRGVLIKGGAVLESLGRLRAVVFDKTGTLTLARLRVSRIVAAGDFQHADVLRLAAGVEQNSEHPVGRLIVDRARSDRVETPEATDFQAHPGLGAQALVDRATVRVGSPRFLRQSGIEPGPEIEAALAELGETGCTVVLVARDEEMVGAVAVQDTIRSEAGPTIRRLRDLGIDRIAILTGDNPAAAQSVADALEVEDVRSGLLPADKVAAIRQIQRSAAPVAMVGDGINDAPSLVAADVGVAMADIGTDVAISSADVVLMGDDLSKLIDAIGTARRMLKIIRQNILGFALVFNVLAVAAASLGWISPVVAAVLHQVSSLTVVLNSLRLLVDLERWRHRWGHFREALGHRRRLLGAAAMAMLLSIYGLGGLHVVRIGQVAVVRHFGKIAGPVEPPGLHYRLPYPFGSHVVVAPDEVRRVEIGFRTLPGSFAEPPAYEWNVQHRGGRHEGRPEEATLLAGDESLVDVNLVVHYRVVDPLSSLFHIGRLRADGSSKWDALVRNLAEAALRAEMSARTAGEVLGSDRTAIETDVRRRVGDALEAYRAGLAVESVCLGDVHPPLEVVPAFREVASALEEKEAKINEAEAYQFETEALAEGEAKQKVLSAEGFRQDRIDRARGQAVRFIAAAEAYGRSPDVTGLRLYLETIEKTLAGRRKVIVDSTAGGARRQLFLGSRGMLGLMPTQPPATDAFSETDFESEPY